MKIELDYSTKTITIEESVNMKEFFDKIERALPDWREWKLETKTIINWTIPATPNPYIPSNPSPWYVTMPSPLPPLPVITCEAN